MAIRRLAAVLSLVAAGLAVFLFRDPGPGPAARQPVAAAGTATPPSGVDEHFARMMVVHHEQAVRMSRTLLAKGDVPERVRLIAEFIARDQQREIDLTNDWLTAWGRPPVTTGPPAGGGLGQGHGMLTEVQLAELDRADAKAAPAVFLRLMIEHHRGAITMSHTLLDAPAGNPYTRTMAKHVLTEQTAENEAMSALLET